jgi:hypothetical protein
LRLVSPREMETYMANEQTGGSGKPVARWANHCQLGYNAFEFLLDFGQAYDPEEHETIHTRIVMSPVFAKELQRFLGDSIRTYEQTFGMIKDDA